MEKYFKKSGVKIKIEIIKLYHLLNLITKMKKISTIFTYEMLKKKYLATNSVFLSLVIKKKI